MTIALEILGGRFEKPLKKRSLSAENPYHSIASKHDPGFFFSEVQKPAMKLTETGDLVGGAPKIWRDADYADIP